MAELHVSKKTLGKLFSEMQNRKFVVPDYQRPYKWDTENVKRFGTTLKILLKRMLNLTLTTF